MKTKHLSIFLLTFTLLIPSLVFADRGMIVIGPREVSLQESGQDAIVAWNGNEEVIILSTDTKSSESTLVLGILPLPSNPTKVEENSFNSFEKLTEIINKKIRVKREREMRKIPGVMVTFNKKIGAHDVTVVKVNDLDYFVNWVKNFTVSKGIKPTKISPEFKNSVASYLERNIKFFVFDVIEVSKGRQSIKPLLYRFKTDFLYYPLKITATSDAGRSISSVNIFLITKGIVNKTIVSKINLWPRVGFDYNIELSEKELKEVSPEIADLFSSAYVMNAYFLGSLGRLIKDFVVYSHDIHTPTFFEKISKKISAFLVFRYISELWKKTISFLKYGDIVWGSILAIFFFSPIAGIPSVIFIMTQLTKKLLKKYNLKSFSYSLLACVVSITIITLLLLSNITWLMIPILNISSLIGFSMIVFLIIKFFKKYIF